MNTFITIEDCRYIDTFKKETISKFKKTDVIKEYLKCLYNKKIEDACFWSAELVCSGNLLELWNVILQYMSQYIHYGNPKLPIYIIDRYTTFKDIMSVKYISNELDARNDKDIRHMFIEISYILCMSQIKHVMYPIKIKNEQLQLIEVNHLMKAIDTSYGNRFFIKGDPMELFIPINEFAYHLSSDSKCKHDALFWSEWILSYESYCKQKKHKLKCERRSFAHVPPILQMDIIWILWEFILYESKNYSSIHQKIIKSLFELYCIRFSIGMKRKRRYILYHAVGLLCETCLMNIPISSNGMEELNSVRISNNVYKQIKLNEKRGKEDYLFHGLEDQSKKNREMTIKKLSMLNDIHNKI